MGGLENRVALLRSRSPCAASAMPMRPPRLRRRSESPLLWWLLLWRIWRRRMLWLWISIIGGQHWAGRACEGSITVSNTGVRFRSRPEPNVGRQLWRGYEYMANLQYLSHHESLCPPPLLPLPSSPSSSLSSSAVSASAFVHFDGEGERKVSAEETTAFNSPPTGKKMYNVTVPTDGLPIALLVKSGGGCSLAEKMEFALSAAIQPPGLVRFLLVEDPTVRPGGGSVLLDHHSNDDYNNTRTSSLFSSRSLGSRRTAGTLDSNHNNMNNDMLYILYISPSTHVQLIQYLLQLDPAVRNAGGPTISMDAHGDDRDSDNHDRSSDGWWGWMWDHNDREGLAWIGVSALLSACACCMLICAGGGNNGGGWWSSDHDQDNDNDALPHHPAHPPRRPQRRRLTAEQVQRLLPEYRIVHEDNGINGGTILRLKIILDPLQQPTPPKLQSQRDPKETDIEVSDDNTTERRGLLQGMEPTVPPTDTAAAAAAAAAPPPTEDTDTAAARPPPLFPLLSTTAAAMTTTTTVDWTTSCCSICLEDYQAGDKARLLPCNHAFHSQCIAKWLVERSATCPLCKYELWDDSMPNTTTTTTNATTNATESTTEEDPSRRGIARVPLPLELPLFSTAYNNSSPQQQPQPPPPPPPPRPHGGVNGWDRAWHRFFTYAGTRGIDHDADADDAAILVEGTTTSSTHPPGPHHPPIQQQESGDDPAPLGRRRWYRWMHHHHPSGVPSSSPVVLSTWSPMWWWTRATTRLRTVVGSTASYRSASSTTTAAHRLTEPLLLLRSSSQHNHHEAELSTWTVSSSRAAAALPPPLSSRPIQEEEESYSESEPVLVDRQEARSVSI